MCKIYIKIRNCLINNKAAVYYELKKLRLGQELLVENENIKWILACFYMASELYCLKGMNTWKKKCERIQEYKYILFLICAVIFK